MRKAEALKILEAEQEATPQQAKAAYRRQAMKWHPDRNPSQGARAKFQEVASAHQMLVELAETGKWLAPEDGAVQARGKQPASAPASGSPKGEAGASGKRESVQERGSVFFTSLMAMGERMLRDGAGSGRAGEAMGQGFDQFLHEGFFGPNDLPTLRGAFLLVFWAQRRSGMFAALASAKQWCARRGWATSAQAVLDPRVAQWAWSDGSFYIFDAAGEALPNRDALWSDLAFYREWIRAMPELFANFPSVERSLRLGLFFRGGAKRPLWIEQALLANGAVAGLFIERGTPRRCKAKKDWLGMAIERRVPASKLGPWLEEESSSKLIKRMELMDQQTAADFAPHVEAILRARRQWGLAGAWASPRGRLLAAGHRSWLRIEKDKTGPSILQRIFKNKKSKAWVGRASAIWGAPDSIEAKLGRAMLAAGPAGSMWIQGEPLGAACGLRALFEKDAPLDFIPRARAIERVGGVGALREKDSNGLTGLDWFEMAIKESR